MEQLLDNCELPR